MIGRPRSPLLSLLTPLGGVPCQMRVGECCSRSLSRVDGALWSFFSVRSECCCSLAGFRRDRLGAWQSYVRPGRASTKLS
jgi:hypothetical protein